jgi:SAM-dependent methyltransferase
MATHQSLSGMSDENFLERLVATYPERFGADFWAVFDSVVAPRLPARPVIVDLGCGPGLFLHELGQRYPHAALYGYDVTPAMIAYARQLPARGGSLQFAVHDVATQALPHDPGSVHLVAMTSVLHIVDEPLPVLAEVRRVLSPQGTFLLHDWIRLPLRAYLAWRLEHQGEAPDVCRQRGFRLFPVHCKYTVEDWRWLLAEAGFALHHQTQLRPTHWLCIATPAIAP